MDILAVTDFPDIRLKAAIQSDYRATSCSSPARAATSCVSTSTSARSTPTTGPLCAACTSEQVIAIARRVLHPYTLDVKEIAWFSIYEVGQRLTDKFDDVPAELVGVRAAARLHRRRRLPHAQRQGRPGHERVDAGRVQPRLEARRRAGGPQPRVAAAHLLGRTPGDRPGADRLRQGVVDDHGVAAEGPGQPRCRRSRPGRAAGVLRAVASLHGGRRHPLRAARRSPARRPTSTSPRDSRSACGSTRLR